MKLSIVTTMYRSSPFISEFYRRVENAVSQITNDYELIFVNDGSPDDSLAIVLQLQTDNPKIQIVDLSRNFGHHAAIVAGLEYAEGDYIFLIDCDLEEQPEWLPLFIQEMEKTYADVVFGVQQKRMASKYSNFFGSLFWKSLNIMSTVNIPHNPMTCRLMNKAYVDALMSVGDRVLYLAGVCAWAGFIQEPLYLIKTPRSLQHKSTYSLARKLMQVVDSFTSFSASPLFLVFLMGLFIWLGSVFYGFYLLVSKLLAPNMIMSGFTSMMLSIWFLGGIIIFVIGLVGLYISKIFQEVKRRPLFITKKIYRGDRYDEE